MVEPQTTVGDVKGPSLDTLEAILDINYTWGYEETRQQLRNLYTKARRGQWIPEDILPWETEVDLAKPNAPEHILPLYGSSIYANMAEEKRREINIEIFSWTLSQFLHGEQGALLAAAQLVNSVPELDSKLYGSTQVVDEARHVDVYNRYLQDKIGFLYPVNPHLKSLLDLILKDSRWDLKFLGMQIMVEGLALSAFGMIRNYTTEPLLHKLTQYVMQDEARHVAFGVLSLRDYYDSMSEKEVREREDFVYEAAVLMRDRFLYQEVWEKTGLPMKECMEISLNNTGQIMFRQLLFSKIVPAIKKVGLLSNRQRERFHKLNILQYEHWTDPEQEAIFAEVIASPVA
ncbi:MAG: ferritin-like domain-containing protein [Proteobacteria bacterium]|nr:ferritin-like domain-containing protein [Pseudomonadota bacterium]